MVRDYRIPCQDCSVEFDGGSHDGPRAYVFFCPLHAGAKEMEIVHRAVLESGVFADLPKIAKMVRDLLQRVSPSAPVGAALAGCPVAPGANLQDGAVKQT